MQLRPEVRNRPTRLITAVALVVATLVSLTSMADVRYETIWIPMIDRSIPGEAREIKLEATLYRPPASGPFPVLLFNHGSTGAGLISPKQTVRFAEVAQFFTERGFAVLTPMRRGRGASDGDYDEGDGTCDTAALARGIQRGLADVDASLAFVLQQPWMDRTRLVLGGMSRGGLLSVVYPSERRVDVKAVINFAGGWTADRCDSLTHFNEETFRRAGRAKLPMLWLYAENDRNYWPTAVRAYHRAFTSAGGAAELRIFPPIGYDGHSLLPRTISVWKHDVTQFLSRIGFETAPTGYGH